MPALLMTVAAAAAALLSTSAPAYAQALLHPPSGGLEQPAAESSLQPGLSLGSDPSGPGVLTGSSASDGLRLQFGAEQPAGERFGLQFFDPGLQPAPAALEGSDPSSLPSLP
jgi:hypothetical protein